MAIDFNTTVKMTGAISPTGPMDTYPTHFEDFSYGGYRSVDTLADRNAITNARRKPGMLVNVIAEGLIYQLDSDLTTWVE